MVVTGDLSVPFTDKKVYRLEECRSRSQEQKEFRRRKVTLVATKRLVRRILCQRSDNDRKTRK